MRTVGPAAIVIAALMAPLAACQGARSPEVAAGAPVAGPVHFLRASEAATSSRSAQGVLRLDAQGCLRLGEVTLSWPEDAALDISQPGVVRVFDGESGVAVRVGQAVAATGEFEPASGRCAGPALQVADFRPLDPAHHSG